MYHKKCQIFDDFWKYDVFLRMIPGEHGTISGPKKHHFDAKNDDFEIKNHGAKHSPSSSLLDRPSADSRGPRAIAFFRPFDPTLMTEILDRSRKP